MPDKVVATAAANKTRGNKIQPMDFRNCSSEINSYSGQLSEQNN